PTLGGGDSKSLAATAAPRAQLDRSTRPCIDQQTRYTRYQIDDGRHRGDEPIKEQLTPPLSKTKRLAERVAPRPAGVLRGLGLDTTRVWYPGISNGARRACL